MELALIIVMGVNGLHARFIRLLNLYISVYGTISIITVSRLLRVLFAVRWSLSDSSAAPAPGL